MAYASRLINKAEKNYHISELEALAIVYTVDKFPQYLAGAKCTVVTDHCTLCWLLNEKNLSPRLIRWALCLQDYDFSIVYKSGLSNHVADCLIREPNVRPDATPDLGDRWVIAIDQSNSVVERLQLEQQSDRFIKIIRQKLNQFDQPTRKDKTKFGKFTEVNGIMHKAVD